MKEPPKSDVQFAKELCAGYFGVSAAEVDGPSRSKSATLARHFAMCLCREHLGMSFPEIGHRFQRDHTSVMSAIQSAEIKRATVMRLGRDYQTLLEHFRETTRREHMGHRFFFGNPCSPLWPCCLCRAPRSS